MSDRVTPELCDHPLGAVLDLEDGRRCVLVARSYYCTGVVYLRGDLPAGGEYLADCWRGVDTGARLPVELYRRWLTEEDPLEKGVREMMEREDG